MLPIARRLARLVTAGATGAVVIGGGQVALAAASSAAPGADSASSFVTIAPTAASGEYTSLAWRSGHLDALLNVPGGGIPVTDTIERFPTEGGPALSSVPIASSYGEYSGLVENADGSFYVGIQEAGGTSQGGVEHVDANGSTRVFTVPPELGPADTNWKPGGLVASPDGNTLYFGARSLEGNAAEVFQLPQSGGSPSVVAGHVTTDESCQGPFSSYTAIPATTICMYSTGSGIGTNGGMALVGDDLYVLDILGYVDRVDLSTGTVVTIAGGGSTTPADGVTATQASLGFTARGLTADSAGDVFIAASSGDEIFKITPDGTMHLIAGGGSEAPDAGVAPTDLQLTATYGLAVDPFGNLYASVNTSDGAQVLQFPGVASSVSVPDAPSGLSVSPTEQGVKVTFAAPSDDGGAPVTSYTVTAQPHADAGTDDDITTKTVGSPGTVTLVGLTDGTEYDIAVTATNEAGTGPAATGGPVTPGISAVLHADTTSGTAPLTVHLDASDSAAPDGATFQFFCGDSDDPTGAASASTTAECDYSRGSPDAGWDAYVVMHDPATGRDYQADAKITVASPPDTVDDSAAFDPGNAALDIPVASDGSLTSDLCGDGVTGVFCGTVDGVLIKLAAGPGTFQPGTHVQVFTGDTATLQAELGSNVQVQGGFAVTWTPRQTLTQPLVVTIPQQDASSGGRAGMSVSMNPFTDFLGGLADELVSGAVKVAQTVGSLVQAAGNALSHLWNSGAQTVKQPNDSTTNAILTCASLSTNAAGKTVCNGPFTWQQDVPTDVISTLIAGGRVIAAGAGNVIAAGGGNVIAAGGGNVIAAGGGNLTIPGAAVIAAGGGNVIAAGGGNVIAAGGGNVIAAGGGNVIAAGAGNLTMTLTSDPGFSFAGPADPTPPTVSATVDADHDAVGGVYPYGTDVTVHLHATSPADPAIDITRVDYTVDGDNPVPYTIAAGDRADVVLDKSGDYTITYGAQDADLNEADPQTVEVHIAGPTPAGAPTGVTGAETADHTGVDLSWTAPDETGTPALTGYAVTVTDQGSYGGGSDAAAPVTRRFDSTDTHQTITGLTPGHTYVFQVAGYAQTDDGRVDGATSDPSAPVDTATAPSAPTGLSATAGNGKVDLTWTAPADGGGLPRENYFVYRSDSPVGVWTLLTPGPSDLPTTESFTDTTAVNGHAYYYAVTAKNAFGESEQSAAAGPATPIAPTTTVLSADPNPVPVDASATFTATVSPVPDGGTVAFAEGGTALASCEAVPVADGSATCTVGDGYPATGQHEVTATYSGTAAFASSASDPLTLAVGKGNQSIAFPAPSGVAYGDGDFVPGASASSGLAVSVASSTPGVCTVVGGEVHVVHAGSCTLIASQAGDDDWNAAPDVSASFMIGKAALTVTAPDASMTFGDTPPTIHPSYDGFVGTDDAAVLDTAPTCSADPDTATTSCSGGVDGDYAFTYVEGHLSVSPADQVVHLSVPGVVSYAQANVPVTASSDSGGPVTLSASPARVCTVSGARLAIHAAGVCMVSGAQAGDAGHDPASASLVVTVHPVLLRVTAAGASAVVRGRLPRVAALFSGFVRGDSVFSLDRQPVCRAVRGKVRHVRRHGKKVTLARAGHTICTGARDVDYAVSYRSGRLGVAKNGYAVTSPSRVYLRSGAHVSVRLAAVGKRHTFKVKGTLPAGLRLTHNTSWTRASITGTPTARGVKTVTVVVRSGKHAKAKQKLTLETD